MSPLLYRLENLAHVPKLYFLSGFWKAYISQPYQTEAELIANKHLLNGHYVSLFNNGKMYLEGAFRSQKFVTEE